MGPSATDVGSEAIAEMLGSRLVRLSMAPLPGLAAITPRPFLNVEPYSGGSLWPKAAHPITHRADQAESGSCREGTSGDRPNFYGAYGCGAGAHAKLVQLQFPQY